MNKEFIPYKLALEMKQLGFDESCFGYYYTLNGKDWKFAEKTEYYRLDDEINIGPKFSLLAPTYSQCFRFFREKYELHSFIYSDFSWNISGGIWDLDGYADSRYDWDSEPFKTFEEAELNCLSKLIEIVKENTK